MRKVEELGRFSIVVDERPTKDTYYLRWWDPEAKKTKTRLLKGSSLAEVRPEALDIVKGMISADDIISSADPIFSEVWILYQTAQARKITPERHHLNELRWNLYYESALGGVRCSRILPALVRLKDRLLRERRQGGEKVSRAKQSKPLSPNTVYDIVQTARAAVEHARSTGAADVKPVPRIEVEGVVGPREGRTPKGRILSVEEIGALIDAAATTPHVLTLVALHVGSGARTGSLLDLLVEQILWEFGVIDLLQKGETDNNKPRSIIPISGPLSWMLREAADTAGKDHRVVHFRSQGLLGKNGTQIIFRVAKRARIDGKLLKAEKLERLNFYSFRHTIANWLRDYVPDGYISAVLGHTRMVSYEDRDRMHELAARTTETHYFDHREIARQKKLLSYAYDIRDALDEHYWPAIQRHCQTNLRLGTEAKLKQPDENNAQNQICWCP